MYVAKSGWRGGVSFFDLTLIAGTERNTRIDLALRRASLSTEFFLVYQPQFSVDGVHLLGMEVLVRWNSLDLGFVTPEEFIPIAEGNGIITPLSDWIMGINVSPRQRDEGRGLSYRYFQPVGESEYLELDRRFRYGVFIVKSLEGI